MKKEELKVGLEIVLDMIASEDVFIHPESAKKKVGELINKLDEPETLSEEWIENHTASADTISYYSEEDVPVVTVEKLKNLLVPKQEKPETVADVLVDFMRSGERLNKVLNMEVGEVTE